MSKSGKAVFADALERAANGRELSWKIFAGAMGADEQASNSLFELADEVRSRFVGEDVHLVCSSSFPITAPETACIED